MNPLHLAIQKAIETKGNLQEANKAYLEFLKANFIIPIEKRQNSEDEPQVLFLQDDLGTLMPVFTEKRFLDAWAVDIQDKIDLLHLSAFDLLKGVGEDVRICLDIGSEFYKEFNAGELARLRSMVIKLM